MSTLACAVSNDEGLGIGVLDLFQDGQPVAVRKPVVEQDGIDAFATARERVGRRFRLQESIALLLQPRGQRPADQRLIVHDQDCRCLHSVQYECIP